MNEQNNFASLMNEQCFAIKICMLRIYLILHFKICPQFEDVHNYMSVFLTQASKLYGSFLKPVYHKSKVEM